MDIYTDTSIDDQTQTAGVGCVFLSYPAREELDGFTKYTHRYVKNGSSQTGELFAIHFALSQIPKDYSKKVYLYTDSKDALCLIQNMLKNPSKIKKNIHLEVLNEIYKIFKENSNLNVRFLHVKGHETDTDLYSHGYFNGKSDERALIGRDIGISLFKSGQRYASDDIFRDKNLSENEFQFIADCNEEWKTRITLSFETQNQKETPQKVCSHKDKNQPKRPNGRKNYQRYG